jgi:guanylate kinase
MVAGVILYGPPASGKSTITKALNRLHPAYALFPRLKDGPGRTEEYRMVSTNDLASLEASGDLIWTNHRYGATYAIDHSGLRDHLANHISVLHLGQAEAVEAVTRATPDVSWLVVELRCSRAEAEARLRRRDPLTVDARLQAFDETTPLKSADLSIDTTQDDADIYAHQIHSRRTGT